MIEIKTLSKRDIDELMHLSFTITDPLLQVDPGYIEKKIWEEHLDQNGILYGGYVYGELAGLAFFYDTEKGSKISRCWMLGVDPKYRGKELLKFLMEQAVKDLQAKQYEQIKLITYPDKYPYMKTFLSYFGFASELDIIPNGGYSYRKLLK